MSDHEETCLEIILHAGNGRAEAFEALRAAKEGDLDRATERLAAADSELAMAHQTQTRLLSGEAKGVGAAPTLLLAHALDQLMAAATEKGLIEEMIDLYRRLGR